MVKFLIKNGSQKFTIIGNEFKLSDIIPVEEIRAAEREYSKKINAAFEKIEAEQIHARQLADSYYFA